MAQFDDWRCENFRCAATKNVQFVPQGPAANFLRWYRFSRCELLAGRFCQLYEDLPLRA
jgi:hypothetical protein